MKGLNFTVNTMFVVYSHIDDEGKTYYVGIGDKKRPFAFGSTMRSKYWHGYTKRYCASGKPKVQIDHVDLTHDQAKEYEKFWIGIYGRRDKGTGCLVNMTDGGDGTVGTLVSAEHKEKLRSLKKGKPLSDATQEGAREFRKRNPTFASIKKGQKLSEEHKQALRDAKKGKSYTEVSKANAPKVVCSCLDTYTNEITVWPTLRECANFLNVRWSKVTNHVRRSSKLLSNRYTIRRGFAQEVSYFFQ